MRWLRVNGQKWATTFAIAIAAAIFIHPLVAHVSLIYPPARHFNLDFLDNIRTLAPCGMPKGDTRTSLLAGSSINVTWHLAYPHRGGYKLELLNAEEKPWMDLTPVTGKNDFLRSDSTAQQQSIRIPGDLSCEGCTIRLKREAMEWSGNYTFWSCSDVDIVQAEKFKEDCLGNGNFKNGACECHRLYYGKKCEFKDECADDSDCGEHGSCVTIKSTNSPKKQCYCHPGWFGDDCEKESPIKTATFPLDDYFTRELSKDLTLYWKILPKSKELELVLRGNGTSYLAIGWRPQGLTSSCKAFPHIPAQGFHLGSTPMQQSPPETKTSEKLKDGRSLPTDFENVATEHIDTKPMTTTGPQVTKPNSEPEPSVESEPEPSADSETTRPSVTETTSSIKLKAVVTVTSEKPNRVTTEPDILTESHQVANDTEQDPMHAAESESMSVTLHVKKSDTLDVGEAAHGLDDVKYRMEGDGEGEVSYTHPTTQSPSNRERRNVEGKSGEPYSVSVESSVSEVRDSSNTALKLLPKHIPKTTTTQKPFTQLPKVAANASEPEPEPEPEPEKDGKSGRTLVDVVANSVSTSVSRSPYIPKLDFHAMDCTDIVIGSARGDLSRIRDMYTRDRSTPRDDSYWGEEFGNSLTAAAADEKDGVTTVVFRRPLSANEVTDYAIEDTAMHVIWAKGQELGAYVHSPPSGLEKGSYSVRNFYQPDELKYHGGKAQRGVLSLNFLENVDFEEANGGSEIPILDGKSNLRGEWKTPASCRVGTCEYHAMWEYLPATDEILFTISSSHTDQWTGIAFSQDKEMPNTDAILGWVDNNGRTFVMDTWIPGYEPPQLDENQDVTNYKGSKIDGRITLEFRRKRSTGDSKQDLAFSDTSCLYLIFPYNGGLYNAVSKKIRKHSSTPAVSETKICIDGRLASVPNLTYNEIVPTTPAVAFAAASESTRKEDAIPTTEATKPQTMYYVAIRLPNQPLDEAIERGIDFKMLIRERLQNYMMAALENEVKGIGKVNVTHLESEKNESHVIAKIAIHVDGQVNQSAATTVRHIKEILNVTISTGKFGQLLVDPAYLIVESPGVNEEQVLQDITTGGVVFDQDLVIYIVIAVAIGFGLLVFIQIVCSIHHARMARKTRVSKERLISDPGFKEYRGANNYGYDAYQMAEEPHTPGKNKTAPSPMRPTYPFESMSMSKSTPNAAEYMDHDHMSQVHYARRSESLPRPVSAPVRSGQFNNQNYATHDPAGRKTPGSGLQPDFYFMPSQRRYSGEVVRVYVDYNAPNYQSK